MAKIGGFVVAALVWAAKALAFVAVWVLRIVGALFVALFGCVLLLLGLLLIDLQAAWSQIARHRNAAAHGSPAAKALTTQDVLLVRKILLEEQDAGSIFARIGELMTTLRRQPVASSRHERGDRLARRSRNGN